MPQLPALGFNPQNALLRVEPLTNALAGMRQANFENERLGMEQERLNIAKQSHSASMARGQKNDRLNTVKMVGGWAQQADAEQDPVKKQALWQRIKNFDPDAANDLRSLGIDPDDHVNGPKAVIGLLQGYQDPMAQEIKRLQIENQRAGLDYTRARTANMGRQGEAPKTMVVGGRLVRIEGDQARDITPQGMPPKLGTAPAGYRFQPDGNLAPIPGGPAEKLAAETAGKVGMMNEALRNLPTIRDVFLGPKTKQGYAGNGSNIVGETFDYYANRGDIGEGYRLGVGAIESVLRAASGAAVPETEVKRYSSLFLPNPLDTTQTRQRKLDSLERWISSMNQAVQRGRPVSAEEAGRIASGLAAGRDNEPKAQGRAPENGNDLPAPRSREEYMQLPSGATYRDPEGNVRTKP